MYPVFLPRGNNFRNKNQKHAKISSTTLKLKKKISPANSLVSKRIKYYILKKTDSMDMSLSKPKEMVKVREA